MINDFGFLFLLFEILGWQLKYGFLLDLLGKMLLDGFLIDLKKLLAIFAVE